MAGISYLRNGYCPEKERCMPQAPINGYAAQAVGQTLEPFSYEPPVLGAHDVRVAVSHCGVCHTDIQAIDDYYGITDYPFVPGHEIVGTVTEAGPEVTELKVSDRVGIGWQGRSCGKCEWCLRGIEQLCYKIVKSGTWIPYGGFSTSVIADSRFAYALPPAMPSPVAAVLMCAGISVFAPLRKYAREPGLKIAIVGVGGLGHLALQFARHMDYEVTAISSSPEKEEQALAFGAHHFVVSSDKATLEELEFEYDLMLVTANSGIPWVQMIDTLKKKGQMILVGFPDVSFNSTDLVAHEVSITGSFLGDHAAMREMLSFAQTKGIEPVIELIPMSQVNEALRRVKENQARYRIVLVNDI
jgi:uncharacterized zinc-type alcohol dehydrogenase-like protein